MNRDRSNIEPISPTAQPCGHCGYPRTGLPPSALCPECGSPPPTRVVPLSHDTGAATDRSQQAWLFSITTGLILLCISSFYALQSELFINNGGLTLVLINAPAPKLTAGATLLREMGNPAEWGVQGFIAALGTLLAVWLITEPQFNRPEGRFNLRWTTRCVAVITFGGLFGGLLSGYEINNLFWGWWTLPSLLAAVGLVELPANTLLYLYLAKLSKRFDSSNEPRAQFSLSISAWLIAGLCAGGVLLSTLRASAQDQPVLMWRWIQIAYGAAAVATGAIMTLGVLRLTLRMTAATIDASLLSLPRAIENLSAPLARGVRAVRAEPQRFAAVAGLMLWMYFTHPLLTLTGSMDHRRGLGGDLPVLNFIGPKLSAVALLDVSRYERIDVRLAVLLTLVSVWLITAYRPGVARPHAALVRWLPTLALGAGLGFVLAVEQALNDVRQSYWNAAASLLIEAPATLLLYFYCGRLADAHGKADLAYRLRAIGCIAAVLIVFPLGFYVFSGRFNHRHQPLLMLFTGAWYGMVVIVASVMAWALLVRLAWTLANSPAAAGSVQRSADATNPQAAIALANSGVGSP